MSSRPERYRNQTRDREPREVTPAISARCRRASFHSHELTQAEYLALCLVATAGERRVLVTKAELDRAFGILGRLES